MFKRIGFFILTNMLVLLTINIVLSLLGVRGYITANGIDYNSLMVFCLIWGFVGSFFSLMLSKFMAKSMYGVKIVDPNHPQYGGLVSRVYRMAKAAGLSKMPEVGIYESGELNAFATGPSKNNSLVAVSTGLLNQMTEEEVDGVLGHEVAHIANGDMVTMTLIQGVVNAFVMFFARIAAFAVQNLMRGNNNDRESSSFGGGFLYHMTVMVFEIAFGILGSIVVAYYSRSREFRADKGGAQFAGRDRMIKALQKLRDRSNIVDQSQSQALNAMKISSHSSGWAKLFSTHPPLDERIKALGSF